MVSWVAKERYWHTVKTICKIYGKNRQLCLPEFYRYKKYGSNILGLQLNTVI